MMITNYDLAAALAELEADTADQPGNATFGGRWKQVALAAEQLAGASSSANDNINGWMLRAAIALESIASTTGTEENRTRAGLLKRIVDALEVKAGAVYTGSLGYRFRTAALNAVYTPATAPVLTKTSASGINPMAWSTAYTALIPDATDYVVMRYREDSGAWVTETAVLVTSAWVATYIVDGTRHPWPLYDADTFPGGTLVEVQGGVTRNGSTVWGNTVSDTMTSFTAAHLRTEAINTGYGSGPAVPASAITTVSGDKIVVYVQMKGNPGTIDVTGVTANTGAITFTSIGNTGPGANNMRGRAYYADTSGVTSLNLSIALSGSTEALVVHVFAIRGGAAGGPASSWFEKRTITNPDPIDVDGGLSLPTGGAVISSVGLDGSGAAVLTWTGATEVGEAYYGQPQSSAAIQTAAGNITILGQPSGGPGYGDILIIDTAWGP